MGKIKQRQLELLVPAGNLNKLKTAFAYSADAVYLGIPNFSLRVRINDFNLKSTQQAIDYAHKKKKKVYITANIFAHNNHLPAFVNYLKKIKKMKPDAIIASDPGIISLIKKHWPAVPIHLSTQANCTNLEAARFWSQQGIKRIILAREINLKEIKKIHQALPQLELEYFVHGAMCMAYSGRCFLSKLFVDRSANLGDCAQPCRWQYDLSRYLVKAKGHAEELELVEERHGTYLLNSYDLCLIKEIPKLIQAGITSFKIEGRAKSVYYEATVCAAYRQALDLSLSLKNKEELKKKLNYLYQELSTKLVHRGYTTGFLLGEKAGQNIKEQRKSSKWEFCGQVLATEELKKEEKNNLPEQAVCFKVHNSIVLGDDLEILLPNYQVIKIKLKKLYHLKSKKELSKAHGGGGGTRAFIILSHRLNLILAKCVLRRRIKNK